MKKLVLAFSCLAACKAYDETQGTKMRIKIGEKHAADVEAARVAEEERKAVEEAKRETLLLRERTLDGLMAELDKLSGDDTEKLAQYPKLVFGSQLAMDQITMKEVRKRLDEEKKKAAEEAEKAAKEKASEPTAKLVDEEAPIPTPGLSPLSLIDNELGACLIYSLTDKAFSAEDIASPDIKVSASGRFIVSLNRKQKSESCQTYFANLLGTSYQENYFAFHVGFIAIPQDL